MLEQPYRFLILTGLIRVSVCNHKVRFPIINNKTLKITTTFRVYLTTKSLLGNFFGCLDDLIDQAIFQGLLRIKIKITVKVALNYFKGLSRVFRHHII